MADPDLQIRGGGGGGGHPDPEIKGEPGLSLVLTLETSEMSPIFVFTTKTTQPHPQVFSVLLG